jgi:hypothetical protein
VDGGAGSADVDAGSVAGPARRNASSVSNPSLIQGSGVESGPLRAVHLLCLKWPEGLVN